MAIERLLRTRFSASSVAFLAIGAAVAAFVFLAQPNEGDPPVFMGIANRVASGEIPYRDFPVEYPPLALLPLVLPRLLAGSDSPQIYQTWFSAISLCFAVATGAAVGWLARRGWSASPTSDTLATFAGLALASAPLVLWRFDIVPAFMTTLALVAVASGRPSWSGATLGLGALTKVYPALIAPVFVASYLFRRRFKSGALVVAGFVVAAGLVVGEVVVVAGASAFSFLEYQVDRGVEMESIVGGIALLAHVVSGAHVRIFLGFGSWQVDSPVIRPLAIPNVIFTALVVTALVAGWLYSTRQDQLRHAGMRRGTLMKYLLATVIALLITNKVLSPQYVIWLLPFAALMPRRMTWMMLAIFVLTVVSIR